MDGFHFDICHHPMINQGNTYRSYFLVLNCFKSCYINLISYRLIKMLNFPVNIFFFLNKLNNINTHSFSNYKKKLLRNWLQKGLPTWWKCGTDNEWHRFWDFSHSLKHNTVFCIRAQSVISCATIYGMKCRKSCLCTAYGNINRSRSFSETSYQIFQIGSTLHIKLSFGDS